MRFFEFDDPDHETGADVKMNAQANLITVLNVIISRAQDENAAAIIRTDALITMVKNTGIQFDYQALVDAYENNEAVGNLVKSFSKEEVELSNSEDEMADVDQQSSGEDSGDAIARISKRVAKRALN